MEKNYLLINGDATKLMELDADIRNMTMYQTPEEAKKAARATIRFFDDLSDNQICHEARFSKYSRELAGLEFFGKNLEIRPYHNLYEAVLDGQYAGMASGLKAITMETVETDGYIFAVRIPNKNKTFGYVIYNPDGTIKEARYAFNFDFENEVILNYLNLFSKDIIRHIALRQAV